jgi:hypothetical protein
VVLGGCVLEECDPPATLASGGEERLDGVGFRIQIGLPRRNLADDRAHEHDIRCVKAHVSDLRDVHGRLVIAEDLPQRLLDLRRTVHLAAVETNAMPLLFEQSGEAGRVARVPALKKVQ